MRKQLLFALALAPLTLQGSDLLRAKLVEQSQALSMNRSRLDALGGQIQSDVAALTALRASVAASQELLEETRRDEAALPLVKKKFIATMMTEAKTAGDRALRNQETLLKQLDRLLADNPLGTLRKIAPKLSETLGRLQNSTAALGK